MECYHLEVLDIGLVLKEIWEHVPLEINLTGYFISLLASRKFGNGKLDFDLWVVFVKENSDFQKCFINKGVYKKKCLPKSKSIHIVKGTICLTNCCKSSYLLVILLEMACFGFNI